MATTIPDVSDQVPAGGNVSKPPSGSYGDVKELEDLQAALPGMEPDRQQAIAPTPASAPPPRPAAPTGGLPPGLLAPSRRPDLPVSAPMTDPGSFMPAQNRQERMIRTLDAIAKDQSMSPETQEWAQRVLNMVVRTPGE